MCQIKNILHKQFKLNLTAKKRNKWTIGIPKNLYLCANVCSLVNFFAVIAICNKVIQARDATLDVDVSNIEILFEDIMKLQSNWKEIWNETKEVALNLKMKVKFYYGRRHVDRKGQRMLDDTSTTEANMVEMNDTDDSPEEIFSKKLCFMFSLIIWLPV